MMRDAVMVPRRLTAENGGKALMMGEFFEKIDITCPNCQGDGITEDGDVCKECDDCGEVVQQVDVSWTTIKAIYARAIDHFTSLPEYAEGSRDVW